jgi:hypothetical protein
MTDEHIKQLVERRIRESEHITEKVFDALRALGNFSLPKDIKKYLDDIIQKELQKDYRTSTGIKNSHELEDELKKKTITMRTILRKLKKLTQEGRLNHVNNRYSVKDELKSDIRIFASQFGRAALSESMRRNYYPSLHTLEQNTEKLIKIFGVYIVYCFTQAAQPVNSAVDKDKLASFWVQNVFSPLEMYNCFLAIIDGKRDKNNDEHRRPFYELDTKTVKKILNLLEKKYPQQYEPLLETSSYFIKGPKGDAADRMRKRKESKERSKPKT